MKGGTWLKTHKELLNATAILLWCVMIYSCKNERARMTNNISMALVWDFRLTESSHRNLNLLNIIRADIPSGEKQVLRRKMLLWNQHFKISKSERKSCLWNFSWDTYGILGVLVITAGFEIIRSALATGNIHPISKVNTCIVNE